MHTGVYYLIYALCILPPDAHGLYIWMYFIMNNTGQPGLAVLWMYVCVSVTGKGVKRLSESSPGLHSDSEHVFPLCDLLAPSLGTVWLAQGPVTRHFGLESLNDSGCVCVCVAGGCVCVCGWRLKPDGAFRMSLCQFPQHFYAFA